MSRVCACGKGHRSQWDGKCGHCRTRKEREAHYRMRDPVLSVDRAARAHGFINETL